MKLEPILFVPDSHFPYQDKRAWSLMIKVGKYIKPAHILIQGDFMDCAPVSSHSKDPRRILRLPAEIAATKSGLSDLESLGAKNLVYIAGNHEDRLERYLKDKAPDLIDFVNIPDLLDLSKRGWEYVPYKSHYKLGKLFVTHDTGTAGPTAHSKALNDFQNNVVIGHTHRMAYEVRGNAQGKPHVAAMFGWLGDSRKADYMHRIKALRDWSLGFGIGYLEPKSGMVYITPVPIVNYTCVVNGKLFK